MKRMKKLFPAMLLMVCMVLSMLPVAAETPTVSVTNIFSNNMVLQRGSAISVFGFCDTDGTEIKVTLGEQTKTATSADGKWKVKLDAMDAAKNLTLTIEAAGGNKLTFTNVAVGEVWLCGGQSNMQFELKDSEDYASVYQATLGTKDIRAFSMTRTGGAIEPCTTADTIDTNNGAWLGSDDAKFVNNISAIGYIAAYEMAQQLGDVAIGLLNLCNGDTAIEAWMPKSVLEGNSIYADRVKEYNEGKAFINGETTNSDGKYYSELDGNGKYQYWKKVPSGFYNRMIAPFQPYTVKGCFWYQGCNNAERADQYVQAFTDLATAWRTGFENPDMPFITVQLAPFTTGTYRNIREAQFEISQSVDDVYLVSTANEGYTYTEGDKVTNAIHPWRKSPVAKRAAHTALNCIYNNKNMGAEYSHAIPTEFETVGTKAVLHFSHTADGLAIDTTTFKTLQGFEVSADGSTWVSAEATIAEDRKSVILTATGTDINYIRYGYSYGADGGTGAVIEYKDGTAETAYWSTNTDIKDNVLRTTFGANLTNGVYPTPTFRLGTNYKSKISVGFYGKNEVKVTDNRFKAGDDMISIGGTYYKKDGLRAAEVNYDGTNIYTGTSLGKNNYNGAEKTAADCVADFATKSGIADTDNHKNVAFLRWGTAKTDEWAFYGYDLRYSNQANAKGDTLVFSVDMYFEAMYDCVFGYNRFSGDSASWAADLASVGFTSQNKIYAGTGENKVEKDFSTNAWHNVTFIYDYKTQKYSVALDGTVFAVNIPDGIGDGSTEGIGCFLFNPWVKDADTSKNVYFDNIKAYRYKEVSKESLDADVGTATQTMNGGYDTFTARVTTTDKYTNEYVKAIAALYCDDVLDKVSVSDALGANASTDFKFDNLDKDKEYQLELFFWNLDNLRPYKASVKTEK